jgi:hypothetical protein
MRAMRFLFNSWKSKELSSQHHRRPRIQQQEKQNKRKQPHSAPPKIGNPYHCNPSIIPPSSQEIFTPPLLSSNKRPRPLPPINLQNVPHLRLRRLAPPGSTIVDHDEVHVRLVHDGTTRLADETEAWTIAVTDADAHWHGWGLLRAAGWLRVGWL